MDQLSQLELGVRRAVGLICPDVVLINVNDDDTLDEVDATPAVHVSVTGGTPKNVLMNTVTMTVKVSCIVIMKHLGGEAYRRLASYPIITVLVGMLPLQELEYEDEDGKLKPVEAGELSPAGFVTIAENQYGIAFRVDFHCDIEFDVTEETVGAMLEIMNRHRVDGTEVASDLITFA